MKKILKPFTMIILLLSTFVFPTWAANQPPGKKGHSARHQSSDS
jgi:hypothetical protein